MRALRLNALRLARQHESRYRTHVTAKNRGGREKENTNTTLSGLRVVRFIFIFCFVLCFVFCASLAGSIKTGEDQVRRLQKEGAFALPEGEHLPMRPRALSYQGNPAALEDAA